MDYQLVEVQESERQDYNNFVAAQASGSFLQSWEWGEWQKLLGREVFRYWILDVAGAKIASTQLVKMPLPFGRNYFYCPYGPVFDLRFQIEDFRFLTQKLQENFFNAVFIRFEPKYLSLIFNPLSLTKTTNIQPGKTLLIDLSKSEEQILSGMHPKTRYNIRLAQKHEVEIQDGFEVTVGHGLFVKEAVELIVNTAKRQGYKSYSFEYYEKIIDFFSLHSRQDLKLHVYKAIYKAQLLASAIVLDFGKSRTFLFGGSADENKNVMAPYLMHWKIMKDAKFANLLEYDFWGIETSKGDVPGFARFKLGFGGMEKNYPGAYDIILRPGSYKLYCLIRNLKLKLGNIRRF